MLFGFVSTENVIMLVSAPITLFMGVAFLVWPGKITGAIRQFQPKISPKAQRYSDKHQPWILRVFVIMTLGFGLLTLYLALFVDLAGTGQPG